MSLIRKLFCVVGMVAVSNSSFAAEEVIGEDGYNKTYNDPSKSFSDRMKEARKDPVVSVANTYGGFTLGVAGSFGPVFDADPDSSSGMGFGLGIEPGYVIQSESWTRLEFGAEIAYHSFTWKSDKGVTATMAPFSVVPRVGFGHTLGNNLFGIMRFGFGFSNGQVEAKSQGITSETDSKMGFVASGAYDVTYGAGTAQFYGGIGATHYKYSFSEVTVAGKTLDTDYDLNLNHVNLHAGMRLKF